MQRKIWIVPAIGLFATLSAPVFGQEMAKDAVGAENVEAQQMRKAIPLTQSRWARTFDYSLNSSFLGEEGVTGVRVIVGRNGRPESCEIAKSSGFKNLDSNACEALMQNARFKIVRGRSGMTQKSVWESKITWSAGDRVFHASSLGWRYPYEARRKDADGQVTVRFTIDREGKASNCRVVRDSGWPSLDKATCDSILKLRGSATEEGAKAMREIERVVQW